MRLLIYGLQNSGATVVALYAGQRPNSIVIPDLWTMHGAPHVGTPDDFCIKATITTSFSLKKHKRSFAPDKTILVTRRPIDNISSLRRKHFANHDGTLTEKLRILEKCYENQELFDEVVCFEDFVTNPNPLHQTLGQWGWELPTDAASFPRSAYQIEQFIWVRAPELYSAIQWGAGQARIEPLNKMKTVEIEDKHLRETAEEFCPKLQKFYDDRSKNIGAVPISLKKSSQDEAEIIQQYNYARNIIPFCEEALAQGNSDDALLIGNMLCRAAPQAEGVWDVTARALEACGRSGEAEKLLKTALEEFSGGSSIIRASILLCLAKHFLRGGKKAEANAFLDSALQTSQKHIPTLIFAALRHLNNRDWALAEEFAMRVLNEMPQHLEARRIQAECMIASGRTHQAIDVLESCISIDPSFAPAIRRIMTLKSVYP